MNRDAEDFVELDLLCANLQLENKKLVEKNKFLEQECSAMRDQIAQLEKQVYGGR
jgi:uncharacterized protein YaaN involved in tellurite resistance